jgi:hypothetical protein
MWVCHCACETVEIASSVCTTIKQSCIGQPCLKDDTMYTPSDLLDFNLRECNFKDSKAPKVEAFWFLAQGRCWSGSKNDADPYPETDSDPDLANGADIDSKTGCGYGSWKWHKYGSGKRCRSGSVNWYGLVPHPWFQRFFEHVVTAKNIKF